MKTQQSAEAESLRSALGSVIHRNCSKWLRFILAILKDEMDAEDVIQEAVRRLLVRDLPFGSEDQLRMYLGRAIGNAAFELYNRRKRERMRCLPVNEQILLPAYASNPLVCMEHTGKSEEKERLLGLIEEGLKRLPTKQHEALRLTILDSRGLSIRDAGATSGIPYSTLRHRSKQGLRSLRKFLEKHSRTQKSGVTGQKSKFRIRMRPRNQVHEHSAGPTADFTPDS
jgi:RNA polymerase sigma-70 factor, ECF subfamily